MTPNEPLVSVNMVTYNHEKYIAESIRSVLDQSFVNLELVIVDDGSTDATAQVIASFNDPRIVTVRQNNQGPNAATNHGLQTCRGRYVAFMSGDDLCHPDRLRLQLEAYRNGPPRLLFSNVDFIDEHGRTPRPEHFAAQLFDTDPHTRAQIYRRFFDSGNFINSITCFTEKAVLDDGLPFDPMLYQLGDYDMWIRLVKKYEFQFLRAPTVRYRIRAAGQNLSAPTPETLLRTYNETYLVMRRFFEDVPADLFREAFHDSLRRRDCASPVEMECEQAFVCLRSNDPLKRLLAIDQLHGLLTDPQAADLLRDAYDFTVPTFAKYLKEVDLFNARMAHETSLYVDTGSGFREEEVCRPAADLTSPFFDVSFDLSRFPPVRGLRWDPVELRFCRVRLETVVCQDRSGKEVTLDPSQVSCNGILRPDGDFDFETLDPMFFFHIAGQGDYSRIRIRGEWKVEPQSIALSKVEKSLLEKTCRLRECEEQLRLITTSRSWRFLSRLRAARHQVRRIAGQILHR